MKFHSPHPSMAALLFLGLSWMTFTSDEGWLWAQALPWLLLAIAAGLWRAHGWARTLAMAVLAALLGVTAWPGGATLDLVRVLLIEPWNGARLEHHTGLHATTGGTLLTSSLLLWLLSPSVRRAFALSDLERVRGSLSPRTDDPVKDDH